LKLNDLEIAVHAHVGEFLCVRIHDENKTKIVNFSHVLTPPADSAELPAVGRLQDFYDTFGSVVFYYDEKSGDAAKRIAPISEWTELHGDFSDWIDDLDDEERSEMLPDWIDTCLVIGETPHSGNYILMPTEGAVSGYVFEFDHDGFEFTEEAKDIVEYVGRLLKPDGTRLSELASHMRFVEDDPSIQWWIRRLSDCQGNVVTTDE
jgi:hypothetical protein